MRLSLRHRTADLRARPLVMGVLNVTPDSFSDGGDHFAPSDAIAAAMQMIADGADFIDIGPESTRPATIYGGGACEVPAEEQIRRAVPVIDAVRAADPEITLSIDTRVAAVAEAALGAGADMINDVSALRDDPAMIDVAVSSGALLGLMHRKGHPRDMQRDGGPEYDDVVGEIRDFLRERTGYAIEHGVDESRIVLDPGIGFGKKVGHNLQILKHLERFNELRRPVLIGVSRKNFIGRILGVEDPKGRDAGSLACAVLAAWSGAAIIRTHAVRSTVDALRVFQAVREA